jgi:hypothetical protein
MPAAPETDWRKDFGLDGRKPPSVFTSKDELARAIPQAHLLRRAFDVLKLDGVLCADHAPLAYFKRLPRITPESARDLHRQFWNHAGAPVLVLVTDEVVQVYSGMTRPVPAADAHADLPGLVATLDRVAPALQEFIVSVESGEFFRQHQRSFDPAGRVDRDLLDNLRDAREKLDGATRRRIPAPVLDALLCRLVFACYLFDRGVIGESYLSRLGIRGGTHLRDVLSTQPRDKAKAYLYLLFERLREDFNGDLFSDDLAGEAEFIQDRHVETLNDFFQGTAVRTGQRSFWPYDFGYIPIETISAIYERFLKTSDEQKGAFYTPRFLAEVVLDVALEGHRTLLGKRFLDPACGSGIFLVGIFNRIAEEWRQANPAARNDRKAKELLRLLQESLFGVDISRTACRITAFSLCLAYLDQLSRRDIQGLQEKGRVLPRLVVAGNDAPAGPGGNIRCADFFSDDKQLPFGASLVIGNPPWGSIADTDTPAGRWCVAHGRPLPDKQIAAAFVWKAVEHVAPDGRVCLVLPHGVLFNHSSTAIPFQRAWLRAHALDRVLNLADFQRFLFEKAGHPAVVVSYRKPAPVDPAHRVEYWAPKADWTVTKAEVITIAPQDRTTVTVGEVLRDLDGPDAPQVWKQRYWATPRDWRLLDRLASYPRLRDHVRRAREKDAQKPWVMAVGFQPLGEKDDPNKAKALRLPSRLFIPASSPALDLVLLAGDCQELGAAEVTVRGGSNKLTDVFRGPHVLTAKGITSTAYADFDVSFQDAIRGIHGPAGDRKLLMFLAAYLRSPLARYFLFHTSSNWGVSRQEAHVEEVLRLPFPLPGGARDWEVVDHVSRVIAEAAQRADTGPADRSAVVNAAGAAVEPLIEEYFDILPAEKRLIGDTDRVIIPSIRPTRSRLLVPTILPATAAQMDAYRDRVCEMLNGWAKRGQFAVRGQVYGSGSLGVGLALLEKVQRARVAEPVSDPGSDLLNVLDRVRKAIPQKHATLDVVRGVMLFDGDRLYVVKPLGQRFWTQTAAMNDADEIAGTILTRPPEGDA